LITAARFAMDSLERKDVVAQFADAIVDSDYEWCVNRGVIFPGSEPALGSGDARRFNPV
jgi:hypothetical protein